LNQYFFDGKISKYSVELSQSGAKKMGMYVVGKITLVKGNETFELPVKLKMNGWIISKGMLDLRKALEAHVAQQQQVTA
jgi:hypothetical protein